MGFVPKDTIGMPTVNFLCSIDCREANSIHTQIIQRISGTVISHHIVLPSGGNVASTIAHISAHLLLPNICSHKSRYHVG